MTTVDSSTVLNSYVDSQAANKVVEEQQVDQGSLWGDFDTFLQILTAQLQNQDPTDPADTGEFTQQLVQYSQVEQQISTNDKLDSIAATLNSNGITPLLSYVDQYVEVGASDELLVQNGQAMMAYSLTEEAQTVVVSVQDDSGNVIATIDGPVEAGINRVLWDGELTDGEQAEEGTYSFVLTAKNSSGDTIEVTDVRVIGVVSSVETNEDGDISMMLGEMAVSDTDVMSVFATISSSASTTEEEEADS